MSGTARRAEHGRTQHHQDRPGVILLLPDHGVQGVRVGPRAGQAACGIEAPATPSAENVSDKLPTASPARDPWQCLGQPDSAWSYW